ncbi:unnamed protein product [Peronospora belbahrii]|uniref:Uncharacterized protein n=1 Tax=Peronospora belbahrii TaxID=622444 RepID=A0ABN8D1N2_9STRA|nr:unnamed protein product [Peronospora belbahrii]
MSRRKDMYKLLVKELAKHYDESALGGILRTAEKKIGTGGPGYLLAYKKEFEIALREMWRHDGKSLDDMVLLLSKNGDASSSTPSS